MRQALLFIALAASLVGCSREQPHPPVSPDVAMRNQILGTWSYAFTNQRGLRYQGKESFSTDGGNTRSWRTMGPDYTNDYTTAGTFEVKGGFLIQTLLKHSDTNARPPYVFRERIVGISDRQLVLNYEEEGDEPMSVKLVRE